MSLGRTLKSIFVFLWAGADGLRKVLHMLLLLFVFMLFLVTLSSEPYGLQSESALVIRPQGSIVEQLEGSAYDRAVEEFVGEGKVQTLLTDILDGLKLAKDDDRIRAVVLDLGSMRGSGLSKLKVIGNAIDEFQESGKPVLATADFYSQGAYYLASRADKAYLHVDGFLFLRGFGIYKNYYKTAIDHLQIDWNVFRVGTHKAGVEPFTRTNMSDEDGQSMSSLIDQLWSMYRSDIVRARDLDSGTIEELTTNFVEHIEVTDGRLAEVYVKVGLIDELVSRQEFQDRVLEHVAEDDDKKGRFRAASLKNYLAERRVLAPEPASDENVAIIVASGTILNGTQPPGTIGGDSTAELLRRARKDSSVKAVVLRVDSGGGSVFASRIIGNEVSALKEAGIPVVASMSSVAASGGYWISMAADRIFASPATITGSIGIYGMFPTFQRTMNAIGVNTDGVGTTKWSGELRSDRPMSDETKQLFQIIINSDYDDFISRVAAERGIDKEQVDRIAQGQVWTGEEALSNGLIDEFGTLNDAIVAAAELAELDSDSYGRKYFEKELSATEQLAVEFLGNESAKSIVENMTNRPVSSIDRIARMLEQALAPMMLFNDPRGSYAHCFCVFE